jgi:hypothetical protein
VVGGCENDVGSPAQQQVVNTPDASPPTVVGVDGGTETPDGSPEGGVPPVYFLATGIETGDTAFLYLNTTDHLDATLSALDPKKGIELVGWASAVVDRGSVFVADANAPPSRATISTRQASS